MPIDHRWLQGVRHAISLNPSAAKIWIFGMSEKVRNRDIQNFEKGWMICNNIEEITRNEADLDLYETLIEVFPQSSCKRVVIYRLCIQVAASALSFTVYRDNILLTSSTAEASSCGFK